MWDSMYLFDWQSKLIHKLLAKKDMGQCGIS